MRDSSLSLRMTGKETSHVLLIKIPQFRFNIEIWKDVVNT
jgi:phenylalanyl-tRNA synthetase beta subunit